MSVCKACRDHCCHTKVEWRNHPLAGHGFTPETGWTHPEAKRLNEEQRTANASSAALHNPSRATSTRYLRVPPNNWYMFSTKAQAQKPNPPEVTHGA